MIKKLRNHMVCSTILYNIKGPQCAKYHLEVEDTKINKGMLRSLHCQRKCLVLLYLFHCLINVIHKISLCHIPVSQNCYEHLKKRKFRGINQGSLSLENMHQLTCPEPQKHLLQRSNSILIFLSLHVCSPQLPKFSYSTQQVQQKISLSGENRKFAGFWGSKTF